MSNPIVIDTPEGIAHFQMARIIAMLKLEVLTGLTYSRGSVLKAVQQQYGVNSRTKKAALNEMLKLYKQTYGWEYGVKDNNDAE